MGTLGLSELLVSPDQLQLHPTYRVAIVETASARPVWRDALSLTHIRFDWSELMRPQPTPPLELLLRGLEPAVPRILTR